MSEFRYYNVYLVEAIKKRKFWLCSYILVYMFTIYIVREVRIGRLTLLWLAGLQSIKKNIRYWMYSVLAAKTQSVYLFLSKAFILPLTVSCTGCTYEFVCCIAQPFPYTRASASLFCIDHHPYHYIQTTQLRHPDTPLLGCVQISSL